MAKLPTAEALGTRPDSRPAGGVVSYRPQSGGEAPALALVQTGQKLERLGDELHQQAKIEEKRLNTLRAEEAWNSLRDAQLDLTVGDQNGFTRKRGGDAVNQPLLKDYSDRFSEVVKRIADGLSNDEQKELFRKRASVSGLEFKEGLLRHVARETDTYSKQVYGATLDTEIRGITSSWNQPNAIALSMERINATINREAERSGWAPEMVADERLKAESKVHSAVIGQALATGQTAFAEQYYNANKDGIDLQTAKTLQKAVEDGAQKQLANGYQSSFLSARNDRGALAALEAQIAQDKTLDDGRKNALLGRIQSRSEMLANQSERAQARWERQIDRQINAVNSITLAGYEPSAEQMLPLVNATKGTPMEGQVRQMVATANATREFRRMLPAQQEATLAAMESQARKEPGKFDVQVVNRLRTIHDNQRSQVREDPITFAVRQGFAEPVPVDVSRPAEIGPQIAQRASLARELRRDYQAPFKILTKEETTLLRDALTNAAPQQKREYFAGLAQSTQGDREAYSAIMAQLAPDDPVTSIAGVYAAGRSEQRRAASDLMLRGQSLLNPPKKEDGKPTGGKLVVMPDDKKLLTLFTSDTDGFFANRPREQSDMFQAAKAIYAARTAEEGDTSGDVSSRRWRDAVRMATGPIETYRGKPIVLPESYDIGRFRDALSAQAQVLVASGRLDKTVTRDRLLAMPVDNIGDGRYVFRAGDGVLVDKDNRPVIVNFNRSDQ